MVKHVKDEYEAKTGMLHRYLAKLKTLLSSFDSFTLEFVLGRRTARQNPWLGSTAAFPSKLGIE